MISSVGVSGTELVDLLEQRQPVHPGHLDVGHDRVVVDLLDPVDRVQGALGRVDRDRVHPEQDRLRQRLEQRGVVVDEQDPRPVHCSSSSSRLVPDDRQLDPERRSAAGVWLDRDLAGVLLDDRST